MNYVSRFPVYYGNNWTIAMEKFQVWLLHQIILLSSIIFLNINTSLVNVRYILWCPQGRGVVDPPPSPQWQWCSPAWQESSPWGMPWTSAHFSQLNMEGGRKEVSVRLWGRCGPLFFTQRGVCPPSSQWGNCMLIWEAVTLPPLDTEVCVSLVQADNWKIVFDSKNRVRKS